MRTPIFVKPENDIHIIRLATGYAIVKLFSGYVETQKSSYDKRPSLTANVVEIKVRDAPGLEKEIISRFSYYYNQAVKEEIKFLTRQYAKVVNEIVSKLAPGKKDAVIQKVNEMVRQIANGDRQFVTQQSFAKMLKSYV